MAKKDTARESQLVEGKKRLEEWGINLTGIQDRSVSLATLTERIGQNPAADVALAALLGDYPTQESAQTLVAWEEKTHDKNARREIHRSLYKLSQKGIQPERAVEQAPTRPVLAPVEPEGYVSPLDGRGDRLVWLVKLKVGGGLHYLAAVLNEPAGMQHAEGTDLSRKDFRRMREDIGARFGFTMIEVPWRYCDFLMHEGYERAKGRGIATVDAFPAYRSHLFSTPAQHAELPLPSTIDREAVANDADLLTTSVQLLQEPEMQRWFLDHERAHHYTDQISQVQESPLILNRYQQQDRFQTVIDKAIEEIFSGVEGGAYARRLEEMAVYFAGTDRLDAAKRALAVALAMKKQDYSGKGIPFCIELVRQSISMHFHEEKQQAQEQAQGSLIMKPSEFAARMQAAQRQRTGMR
jgi:hypothetical protein